MNKQLSGLELRYVIKELQPVIGGKVDKIFQSSDTEFYIRTHTTGVGKTNIRILLPSLMYASVERTESLDYPKGFCMMLRKRLNNSRIKSIEQVGMERIVRIQFETKDTVYICVIELFGKGNIILCDSDMKIIGALAVQCWKDREIKNGVTYQMPELRPSFTDLSIERFSTIIKESQKGNIAKVLAIELGLGGIMAEELCVRSGIDKMALVTSLSDADFGLIYDNCNMLLSIPIEAQIVIDAEPIDVIPFPMQIYAGLQKKAVLSFSEALDSFHAIIPGEKSVAKPKMGKLDKIIDAQQKTVLELENAITVYSQQANLIYEHYMELDKLLKDIDHMKATKNWDEIKSYALSLPFVVEFNLKDKKLVVEF